MIALVREDEIRGLAGQKVIKWYSSPIVKPVNANRLIIEIRGLDGPVEKRHKVYIGTLVVSCVHDAREISGEITKMKRASK